MAIIAKFAVTGMDSSKYDTVIHRLETIGEGAPNGRLYHVCYGDRNGLQVIDIYDNPANLQAFGAKLMPILQELGVVAQPAVEEVYNIIKG